MKKGKIDLVNGSTFGDEAKQKCVDVLADKYHYFLKYTGSNNAGGNVVYKGKDIVLSLIPAGILHNKKCIIANGVLINPIHLVKEIEMLEDAGVENVRGNLIISDKCFLTLPHHIEADVRSEMELGKNKIGSTKSGVTPSIVSKFDRKGVRIGDNFYEDFDQRIDDLLSTFDFDLDCSYIEDFYDALYFIR